MFEIFIVIIGGGYWIIRTIVNDIIDIRERDRILHPWKYDKNGRRIRKK